MYMFKNYYLKVTNENVSKAEALLIHKYGGYTTCHISGDGVEAGVEVSCFRNKEFKRDLKRAKDMGIIKEVIEG